MENSIYNKVIKSNLFLRIVTALILAPVVIYVTYLGGIVFKALILIVTILMAFEWHGLTSNASNSKTWTLVGVLYILLPCLSLIWLRDRHNGMLLVFLLFFTVWTTDVAAYIFGRTIGGWKIAPSISPNKTWSGLIGGAICGGIVGYIFARYLGSKAPKILVSFCVGIAIYAQAGDFIESWIKRKFNTKDSGHILPGHGGVLDRVDGIVTTAPKLVFAVLVDQWGIFY